MSTAKSARLLLPLVITLGALAIPSFAALLPSISRPYSEKRPENFVLSEETPISIGHGILGYMTTSTEPVDILSYGVHFRIPRNYIYTILDNVRDHAVDFELQTLYPDFAGAKDETTIKTQIGTQNWQASMNQIVIYEEAWPDFPPGQNQNTFVLSAEANQPDIPWKYGLLKSTKSRAGRSMDVYFQRPQKNNPGFVVFCDRELRPSEYATMRACDIYMPLSDKVIIHCHFHWELLPHWQEISQKLTKLIKPFIIEEN